jgi:glycosyltransferase involved in cell wall biosynthesis
MTQTKPDTSLPKVLHLSGRPAWCGESNRVLVLCRGLAEKGCDVTLGTSPNTALAERARAMGVPLDDRFAFQKGLRLRGFFRDVGRLRQLANQEAYDIIHVHTSRDTWPAALALGPRPHTEGPRLVSTRHNSLPVKSTYLHRLLYGRYIDDVVLAGDAIRESVRDLIHDGALSDDRLHTVHSSIDADRFDPDKTAPGKIRKEFDLENRLVIGLTGRVSREKGHDVLLAVARKLVADYPELCILLVGEGDQFDRIAREIQEPPLAGHVIMTGPRTDMPDIVAALDILVMPSLWLEASPAVIKEAMALRVPVVASNIGGVPEIMTHEHEGLIVPPGDETALEQALRSLIDNPYQRSTMAQRGRQRILDHFTDESLVDNMLAAYHSILQAQTTEP